MGLGVVTEAVHVLPSQPSVCNQRYHSRSSFLASSFFTVDGSIDHNHDRGSPYSFWQQHRPCCRPGAVGLWTVGPRQGPHGDIQRASGGSVSHSNYYLITPTSCLLQQHSSQTSTWLQAAVGNVGMDINTEPGFSRTTDPGMALGGSTDQDIIIASVQDPHIIMTQGPHDINVGSDFIADH